MSERNFEDKIEQVIPSVEKEESYPTARTFAEALLKHMKGYGLEDLDTGIDEILSSDEGFVADKTQPFAKRKDKLARRIARENFAAIFRKDGTFNFQVQRRFEKGKYINASDFDGKVALWLFEMAGADTRKVKYAYPGETPAKGVFALDFSDQSANQCGVTCSKDWETGTAVADHHVRNLEEARKNGLTLEKILNTCTAKIIFEGLDSLGLFDRVDEKTGERLDREALRKVVELVTMIDNKRYPHDTKTFEGSWQTVLGLYQHMKLEDIYNYFRIGGTATSKIEHQDKNEENEEENALIDKIDSGLFYEQKGKTISLREKRRQMIEQSNKRIKRLAEDGYVVEIPNQKGKKLKFLVDYIHEEMPLERRRIGTSLRNDAAFAAGFDGVILYNQETKSIFVNIDPLTEDTIGLDTDRSDLNSLVNVRGKMIITDALRRNYMNVSLENLIKELGGDPSKIKGKLKNAIDTNRNWVKDQKRPEGKEQHHALTIFFGEKGWSAILPGNLIVPLPETDDGYDSRFLYNIEIENLPAGGFKVIKVEKTDQMAKEPELPPEEEE